MIQKKTVAICDIEGRFYLVNLNESQIRFFEWLKKKEICPYDSELEIAEV